jgi:N-acetyl-anhydromuramyl-L-alanine amidase AmpD
MEVLKIGSKGNEVKTLQLMLQKKGYAIVADGIFGQKTEDIVEVFQKDNNLQDDGIVGSATWNVLFRDKGDSPRINSTRYVLPLKNYYQSPQAKKAIVLHHTNGWTVVKGTKDTPSMNHFNWWKSTDKHVSTPYSIDYKGNIYEHFDPQYWAYHLGLGKSSLEKMSIGIELTNEGYMTKDKDGKFFWYSGKVAIPYNRPQDEPVFVKKGWRDYNWFAPYSKEQVDSTLFLVKYLCDEFNIKKNFISDCEYHPEVLDGTFEGIYNHANVRDFPSNRPKWDLSPAFPFRWFKTQLEK